MHFPRVRLILGEYYKVFHLKIIGEMNKIFVTDFAMHKRGNHSVT